MNCQTGKYIQHQSKNKPYHMEETDFLSVSCSGLIYLPYLSVLHSREIFQSMSEISASNFVVVYVRKQVGMK